MMIATTPLYKALIDADASEPLAREAAEAFAQQVTKTDLAEVQSEMTTKAELNGVRTELAGVHAELADIRANMVTKTELAVLEATIRCEIISSREKTIKWTAGIVGVAMTFLGVTITLLDFLIRM